MKRLFAISICLLLTACNPPDGAIVAKGQGSALGALEQPTAYQFNGEVDGCRLYYVTPRYGSNFQFAKCERGTTTAWRESCGKNCTRSVAVRAEEEE